MTYKGKNKSHRLSVAEQMAWIRERWGLTWQVTRSASGLSAVGTVQPDGVARQYRVKLTYDGERPRVWVIEPALELRNGATTIPHTFVKGDLCLFRAKYGDWTAAMPIATSVIPWISEWLYWYEIWLVVGEWLGGGEHPIGSAKPSGA